MGCNYIQQVEIESSDAEQGKLKKFQEDGEIQGSSHRFTWTSKRDKGYF